MRGKFSVTALMTEGATGQGMQVTSKRGEALWLKGRKETKLSAP